MSHITKLQTQFVDLECLKEACSELGLELETGEGLTVQDYYHNSVPVEARIPLGQYSLGFQRAEDGTLRMVADFWGIKRYCGNPRIRQVVQRAGEKGVVGLLQRPYVVAATKREVARNPKYRGFRIQEERNQADEVERLVLVRRRY